MLVVICRVSGKTLRTQRVPSFWNLAKCEEFKNTYQTAIAKANEEVRLVA